MNIVITGGSRGIGKSIIQRLHNTHTCIAIARPSKELDQLKTDYTCDIHACDVSEAVDIKNTIDKIHATHGSIDVLINSAGTWIEGPLETNNLETIESVVKINVLGTMYATHAALPHMKKVGTGLIINVGSQSGLKVKAERSVYTATKWAITGFSRSLNEELGPQNIRVTTLYPGTADTELFSRADSKKDTSQALDPNHIADAIEWLLTLPSSVTVPELGIKATKRG